MMYRKAAETTGKIIEKFGTSDVFAIAECAGLKIVYEGWHPATIGEYEPKTKTIFVNRRALENEKNADALEKKIVAHELGHFFAAEFDFDKKEEECFAADFAEKLIGKSAEQQ
ncbi:MAG: hypothetical protein ABI686_14420 [Acidobacteriota bacterium]